MPTSPPTDGSIKHWRAFGPAEWQHVKEGGIGLILGSLLPVGLFYATFRLWSFTAAIVVVLTWATLVFLWHRRRTGAADVFSATTFGFACIKALAGLVSQDVNVYLAWPSLENLIYGSVFFGSALLGRPLLAAYAQRLYPIPPDVRASATFQRAFLVTSGAWLIGNLLRAVVRLWLLFTLPLEVYLIADTLAGWPINISMVTFTVWYPLRELRRAGVLRVEPVPVLAIEQAVEEVGSGTI